MIDVHLFILAVAMIIGLIFSYLAIVEKDLLRAIGYSAVQAIAYTIVFYILMAPDIVLAYVAIAVGVYSALLVFVVSKTERYEVKRMKRAAVGAIVLIGIVLIAGYFLSTAHFLPMQHGVRPLGKFYLQNSMFGNYSARSPEGVTSILWDYRGLDTLYETTVFFLAIIGSLTLFRLTRKEENEIKSEKIHVKGLTEIVRTITKIIAAMILAVSASIALHGHLTPGGGFQGGSALAVVPLLIIAAFSKYALEGHGLDKLRAIIIRTCGLLGILILVLIPFFMGYYLMQNQPIFPARIGGQLTSGTLVFYNFFEFLAVGAGFTAVFLLLSIPEKIFEKILRREKNA